MVRLWLHDVGLEDMWCRSSIDIISIPRFLNRLLGMESTKQQILYDKFLSIYQNVVEEEISRGIYDHGIRSRHIAFCLPLLDSLNRFLIFHLLRDLGGAIDPSMLSESKLIHTDAENIEAYHTVVSVDKGTSFSRALEIVAGGEVAEINASVHIPTGFYKSRQMVMSLPISEMESLLKCLYALLV